VSLYSIDSFWSEGRAAIVRCGACNFDNPPGESHCVNCQAALETRRCVRCDAPNAITNRFCPQCGTALGRPAAADAELRHITVMFCDLHRSTVLAETMDIEDYANLIKSYLRAVKDVVDGHQGHTAQYMGDGVVAYFGYPAAREDDALRAVQCALTAMGVIADLNAATEKRYGISIKVRIGVHTGNVITGEIGSEGKWEQLALGSVPNVASRIQSQAKPGEVLISDSTYRLVQRDVTVESLGATQLKHVSESVSIYRVSGIRQQRADKEIGSEPPFVGRQQEMLALLELHAGATNGPGRVVLIRAEAGMGKSRLLDELQHATDGSRWVICRCSEVHIHTPLHPLVSALSRMMNVTRASPPEERESALAQWMSRGGIDSDDARNAVRSVFGIGNGADGSTAPGQTLGERLEYLKQWLYGIAAREPLVFAVEDAHWADPSTREFVTLLADGIDDSGLFAVVTARPEFRPAWAARAAVFEMGRLSEPDCERLLRDWPFNILPDEVNRELIRKSDGVPLYLEELTRTLVVTQPTLKAGANLEEVIPDTLRDMLMARIDQLGNVARDVLQIGAVLGRSFNRAILWRVLKALGTIDVDLPQLDELLGRIVDTGLIIAHANNVYRFKHSLIQGQAYEALTRSRRATIHTKVLEAMLRDFPEAAKSDPATLARHQEGAGQIAEAAESYRRAGNMAWDERNAYDEAIGNFDSGLVLVERLPDDDASKALEADLLHDKLRPMQARRGYANVDIQPLLSRLRLLTRDRFNTLLSMWGYHCMNGDKEETIEIADKLHGLVDESKASRQTASAKFVVGSTEFYQGHYQRAKVDLDEAIRIGEARGVLSGGDGIPGDDSVFLSYLVSAWCTSLLGHPEQADAYLERLRRTTCTEFAEVQLNTWQMFCNDEFERDPAANLQLARETESIAEAHGFDRWVSVGRIFQLRSRLLAGERGDELLAELKEILGAALAREEVTEGYDLTRTANVLIRLGEYDVARSALERASELGRHNLGSLHMPEVDRLVGVLAVREGREDAAGNRFTSAIESAARSGSRTQQLRAHVSFATEMPAAAAERAAGFRDLVGTFDEGLDTPLVRQARALIS